MIRLMITDDHVIMREGLKQLFRLAPDIQVAAEATNGAELQERLREGGIDLVLLDMSMPGICGEDLVARIRLHHPSLPILVLSMHNAPQIAQRALKAGANGYITKDRNPETLFGAIRKVAGGGRFLDPRIAEELAFDVTSSGGADHNCLSDREFQVMRLLVRGLTVNDIADELAISNKTVSTHKARLMEKMGFASGAQLVRYAVMHGLCD
ncbi:MAG TPA: response regulator transcription factor [Rhodocyclaceae bacterium]|nr:response regulator transcription factor [Rhodocyclaceae bacterium]